MTASNWHQLSLSALSRALSEKAISSLELTRYFLDRIAQHDSTLNSFITVTAEQAQAQAREADARIANKTAHPLTGIPIAHKDIFCTQGIKTSCGSRMLDNFVAPYNATAVERLAQAGMVLLGKTNMDEFAMGSSNETSFYGPCRNPWDTEKVPGGSSGGSAAAVAARLVPVATGTDTGGSIRQPAALTGLTGLKPTYGRVSRFGMIAFASSLDQGGPLCTSAEDVAWIMESLAGFDEKDSTSLSAPVPAYSKLLNQSLKGLRIGIPEEFIKHGLRPEIADCLEKTQQILAQLGATFVPVQLPLLPKAIAVYYVIAPAECSSNLARYDGVRFGYRSPLAQNLDDLYTLSRTEGFGSEVKRRILTGTYVLSAGHYDAFYTKAQQVRTLIAQDFQRAFGQVDVILGPTTPDVAFPLGSKSTEQDPVNMYLSDIYTIAPNLAGLPSLSMPAGLVDDLPVGMQLIGNYLSETQLLQLAHQYQLHTDWHQRIPAAYA